MLILRRKEGQWVEITHRSGDVIRVGICNVRTRYPGQVDMVLDDDARNFIIQRPERAARAPVPVPDGALLLSLAPGEPDSVATPPAATAGVL
jgi:hypothetical protein